ncbi:MAG: hypothetical protein IT289_11330, partial [Oligoflexia bacterium]|nr:hypothetical protein [Oligoflexia bacterium]
MKAFLALISLVFCAGLATAQEVSPGKNGKRPEPKPVQTVLFKVDKESGKVFAAVVDRPNMTQEDLKTLASSNEIKFEEIPQKLVATSRDELDKDAAHSAWYWAYWSGGMYWGGAYYNPYWYGYGYGYYNYYAYNWYGS